jgi:hypothetical protein
VTVFRVALLLLLVGCLGGKSHAQTRPAADSWVGGATGFPRGINTNDLGGGFESLRAEHLAEQLKVRWVPGAVAAQPPVTLHYSVDPPGHWLARDWRTLPMTQRGMVWEATLPVEELDIPIVYFLTGGPASRQLSPMRAVVPRLTGMEKPARVFWPFLDGFEDGIAGWTLASVASVASLKLSPQAHDGNAALSVTLPAGQPAVTVGTARVRGWHYSHQLATGLRIWLRAPGGAGKAKFTLHAHARTSQAVSVVSLVEATLDDKWQRVELSFSSFPKFPHVSADWFTIEFSGQGPQEFLVDDLRLLGRWKLPGD